MDESDVLWGCTNLSHEQYLELDLHLNWKPVQCLYNVVRNDSGGAVKGWTEAIVSGTSVDLQGQGNDNKRPGVSQ